MNLGDAVWQALGTVLDPELDEPITDLDFVASCTVSGHDAGADEAERGDRLVELRVVDRPERFEDSGLQPHETPTALSSRAGSSAGTGSRYSSGTSTS